MKISEVEKITGLTAKAIRLYEEKGLISVTRADNSYRDYTQEVIDRLKLVRLLREMGISLSQICLHFNGIITLKELLSARKAEMEKENIFHLESYNKCLELIHQLHVTAPDPCRHTAAKDFRDVLLGLDIGTTNISAVIIDRSPGKVLETYTVSNCSAISADEDFSEFDTQWIADKSRLIADYLIQIYPNIRAIGITGQMHGMVYISEDGKAVSPFYNWQDCRGNRMFCEGKPYCEELTSRTGYICSSGFAFTTMFYNKANGLEPKNAKTFCTVADYLAMSLTGRKTPLVHPSNAASFGLFDVQSNRFDAEAIQKLGLSHLTLPRIATDSDIAGYYKNIPVSVAIGDNQASIFGSIKNEKCDALVNFGTGSQVSVVSDSFIKTGDSLELRPYLFGKYLVCGCALCGGKAYAILERFFSEYAHALAPTSGSQYSIMNTLAEKACSDGALPEVSTLFCGTRQNPSLRGSISEISDTNFTPGNLIAGTLYGMAKELKAYFDCMSTDSITRLVASGNAVKKNPVFQKILEDVFGRPVVLTEGDEEAAVGSALFADIACGLNTNGKDE